MEHLPEIFVGIIIAVLGWLIKDKIAGVKEIDLKLSEKIDKLMELVYELKSAVKGIDDLAARTRRVEDRLDTLERERR